MTGSYCGQCGAQTSPGAGFCATCGAAVVAPAPPPASAAPATPPPPAAPAANWHPAPQQPAQPAPPAPSVPQQAQPPFAGHQQPVHPQPYAQQQPAHQAYATAEQPYAGAQPQQQWPGQPYPGQPYPGQPYPGQAPQPAPAPWGAQVATAQYPTGAPRRNPIDALLTGDWGGAAKSAGIAVGAMLGVSLIGMLLISQGDLGFRETLALIFAGVCLAVGGDAFVQADTEGFGASVSFGVLPLTITFVGLGLLGWSFARQLRRRPPATATDGLLHGVRTVLVFTVCFLPLSLLTRYQNDEFNAFGLTGQLGIGVFSSLFGAFLFAVAALGLTWFLRRATPLAGRVAAFRDKALAPLVGAVAVFAVGLLAVLVLLVHGLINGSEQVAQLGGALIAAGNGALLSVLLSAGVPLGMEGSASTPLAQFAPSGSSSVDLLTLTDLSAWFWLAPIVLLAATLLVATALIVRQNTVEDARREGLRFAGALAVVAFVATLLLRIGADSETSGFDASAGGSVMFNPLLAAVVLGIWGLVTGLVAPVVATKVSSGFVMAVRRRFGAAGDPPPPVQ
jgi:hypothetical protein